uniref:Uncharacterized protein n=1 Tax=Heterorhabditis bacteriophora TaxID=37862 RepID=A0A1I7WBZ7_HETBA
MQINLYSSRLVNLILKVCRTFSSNSPWGSAFNYKLYLSVIIICSISSMFFSDLI